MLSNVQTLYSESITRPINYQMTDDLSVVEPSRLCAVCDMALRSNIWCLSQPHHKSGFDLEKASDLGCYICGTIRHSHTWSRRLEECRSNSFQYAINLHNAGFVDTLEGLIVGKSPSGCCWAFQLWKEPGILPIPTCQTFLTKNSRSCFWYYLLQTTCLTPSF